MSLDETAETSVQSQDSINQSNVNLTSSEGQPQETTAHTNEDFLDRLSPNLKRLIGIALSIFSGVLYGESNTPVLLSRDEHGGNYLDYLFSFYTGILVSAVCYFVIYAFAMKLKPKIYSNVTLAAFVSGNKIIVFILLLCSSYKILVVYLCIKDIREFERINCFSFFF